MDPVRRRRIARRPSGQSSLVSRLAKALRGERRHGRAGHWTYDLNRHIALMQAYRAERALLSTH
ncbi:hypothetical protein [Breoghania sp.]|uniref:hypothetical protein n=1 Tax=Breoghania sp. TaxID=2065378 RepID=UPI002609E163|nr:hypothetical protein [Breoghania sp.]MDJ0931795.1 hypothetical protein [Breoghania sp.]